MRFSDYLAIIVIIALTYFFIDSRINPIKIVTIDTLYTPGEATHDTLWNDTTIYIDTSKVVSDTLYIDSSGVHAKADFSFEKDSVKVTGKVFFDQPLFSFSVLTVKYPYRTIASKQIDTLRVTNNIEAKGFSHGPAVGIGYGLNNKNFDIWVGYDFRWSF